MQQEKNDGFQDAKVIGGLDRFINRWIEELTPVLADLGSYSSLSPPERKEWTSCVLTRMDDLGIYSAGVQKHGVMLNHRLDKTIHARKSFKKRVPSLSLSDDVSCMKGISTRIRSKLKRLGVNNVRDLVCFYPYRHNDYANICKVRDLTPGVDQTVLVTVWEASQTRGRRGRKSTQMVCGDDTGNLRAIWFNNPFMARTLRAGTELVMSGKVKVFKGRFVFESPEYELLKDQKELVHTGRLVPVYSSTEGLPQRTLRRLVRQALDDCVSQVEEFIPEEIRQRLGLAGILEAIRQIHYPSSQSDFNTARRRLAFDELFLVQLVVIKRKLQWQQIGEGISIKPDVSPLQNFLDSLPFSLTEAQTRTFKHVQEDLMSNRPMSRLLQGDVGSGKTVVAFASLLSAVFNGYQGALMVPTEILAEQHFLTISQLISGKSEIIEKENTLTVKFDSHPKPVTFGLLLGSLSKRAKENMHRQLLECDVDIVVGTHALIQSSVDIPKLALGVVDEQHRFGVMQRAYLREKGRRPHLLVMSATPIPRSLALTLYGDLDISVIDEIPPGRHRILTRWVEPIRRMAAYDFIRKEVHTGRQAFIVCPLIEESEVIQSRSAIEEHARLSSDVFPEFSLGILHGKMSLNDKESVMKTFQRGELDILVSTSVVEVGIDIPNASVMLIDGADRFGLAQLHQFRGRVGRGKHQSYCLLLADSPSEEASERLRIVEHVHDGFQLAEEDLRIRGPGDFLGTRQSGLADFKMARITDHDILNLARREAIKLLELDIELTEDRNASLAKYFKSYSEHIISDTS